VAYVRQTKRKLNIRIAEHKKDINKKISNHSVITEHRIEFDYDFGWKNPKILDIEKHYQKRLISEVMNIKAQKKTINLQSDTKCIHRDCNIHTSRFSTKYTNRRLNIRIHTHYTCRHGIYYMFII